MTMALPLDHDLKTLEKNDRIEYYDDYVKCLEAVNSGKADYTQMPSAFMEGLFAQDYYANLVLAADTNMNEELSLAIPKPVDVSLYSILNLSLIHISAWVL